MHWKIKALAQKVLWRMPGGVRLNTVISHATAGHNPEIEFYEKHAGNFFRHWRDLKSANYLDKIPECVLEIGTGWDIDVALLMSLSGVQDIVTVDLFRHVRFAQVKRNLQLFEKLLPRIAEVAQRDIATVRGEWEQFINAKSLENLCRHARIRYIAPVIAGYDEIADESIDLCYSTAVFEHITPQDMRAILLAVRRKLRPGGLMSHVIDLKDHFAYFQSGLPYNHFLRYSKKQWEWWADNPMSYVNRMSPSDWRALLEETGFELTVFQEIKETSLPRLPDDQLHPQQHWPLEELSVGELRVIAKPRKNISEPAI